MDIDMSWPALIEVPKVFNEMSEFHIRVPMTMISRAGVKAACRTKIMGSLSLTTRVGRAQKDVAWEGRLGRDPREYCHRSYYHHV